MNNLDDDLRQLLSNRYHFSHPAPPAQHLIRAAGRRGRRNLLVGGLATVGAVALAGVVAASVEYPGSERASVDYASTAEVDTRARVIETPVLVRTTVQSRTSIQGAAAGTAVVLAESRDGSAVLRVIGIRDGQQQCVASYEDDATVGTLGMTCGKIGPVEGFYPARTSRGTDGLDRLSGVLPLGATRVVISGGGLSKTVSVSNVEGVWRRGAFITTWPGGAPVTMIAVDGAGRELFRESL